MTYCCYALTGVTKAGFSKTFKVACTSLKGGISVCVKNNDANIMFAVILNLMTIGG